MDLSQIKMTAPKLRTEYYKGKLIGRGSTSVVSSVYGETLWEYDYDAFGNLWDTSVNDYNPMQFTGEYFDETAGLLYLRARYYDPSTGRFITLDSYTGELTDPLSQNLYVYCGNNPVAYVDPSGHITVCEFKAMVRSTGKDIKNIPKTINDCCSDTWNNTVPETIEYLG